MIIETRYRDIPWSEIAPFHEPVMCTDGINWEKEMRGKALLIIVPALPDIDGCGGPWYRISKGPVRGPVFACPHLAEIGD